MPFLSIKYTDTATPALEGLTSLVQSQGAMKAGGRGLRNSVIRNFGTLGPNKRFPGASTHFYERAGQSVTQPMVSGLTTTVSITQIGVRQRYLGGAINPVQGKYLTIPAQEEAYGKRAGEFSDLSVAVMGRSSSGMLMFALVRGIPRLSQKKDVMFWLVKGVLQDPDPGVLPPEDDMKASFVAGMRSYVRGYLRRHNPAPTDED